MQNCAVLVIAPYWAPARRRRPGNRMTRPIEPAARRRFDYERRIIRCVVIHIDTAASATRRLEGLFTLIVTPRHDVFRRSPSRRVWLRCRVVCLTSNRSYTSRDPAATLPPSRTHGARRGEYHNSHVRGPRRHSQDRQKQNCTQDYCSPDRCFCSPPTRPSPAPLLTLAQSLSKVKSCRRSSPLRLASFHHVERARS